MIEYRTKAAIDIILDCFGGADGGIGFVRLREFLMELDKRDDKASLEIELLVLRFAKLVNLVANQDSPKVD